MNIKQGPNLPGLDLLGPNLPPRGPICRGPICRGPICRQGAQSAGAQFAGAQSAAKGPNLPGPDLPKNGKLGPKKCGAQFAAKSARGPIYRGPICRGPICLEPQRRRVWQKMIMFTCVRFGEESSPVSDLLAPPCSSTHLPPRGNPRPRRKPRSPRCKSRWHTKYQVWSSLPFTPWSSMPTPPS